MACLAAATMDVVEMVLGGRVNKGLVTLIQQAGGQAVGLCGKDSSIIKARQMVEKDIGFVGDITSISKGLIDDLVRDEYIPVIASVAADPTGQALNVNADIAAGEVGNPASLCCRSFYQLSWQTSKGHARVWTRRQWSMTITRLAFDRTHCSSS